MGEGPRAPRRRRPRVGVDRLALRRLPRLRRPPVPRVLRGLLRRAVPRPARRLLGDAPPRRDDDVPQLGPPRAPADLRRRAAGPRPLRPPRGPPMSTKAFPA